MEGLLGALIVGVLAVLGQAWQRRGDANIRREEKLAEWDRQDKREKAERERQEEAAARLVAETRETRRRTDEAAELLQAAQAKTLARTDEVARLAAETATSQGAQLADILVGNKEIHTLVNNDMTQARKDLLDQTRILVALYRKFIEADKAAGRTPNPDDVEALVEAQQSEVAAAAAASETEGGSER
jgi:hypothetical protein